MTVVATVSDLVAQASAVRLARYAQLIGYPECNFFGVNAGEQLGFSCQEIWTKPQRDMVAKYLAEAQEEIEQETGYFLAKRWVGQGQSAQWQDHQSFKWRIVTRFAYFIEGGIQATSTVQAGAVVDHSTDPAVVGPIVTTVTDEDEIHVFHPGSDVEIDPSLITISGGSVTIEIPRCRMVTEALANNPGTGLDYADTTNFEATVDVKRIYNDSSTEVILAYPSTCTDCTEKTLSGCFYARDKRLGIVDIQYSNSTTNLCRCTPQIMKLNYRCGLDVLTRQAEDAIVRLAHTKMPWLPCNCDMGWNEDRKMPEILTRERLNCPFGLMNGAWIAYQFAQSLKIMRGNVL